MKKFIKILEENQYIRFISIVAVVIGALITNATFFNGVGDYLYSNIFISKNISDKINNLSAGQSINYFRQELGAEKIERDINDKFTEYIFQYKKSYIQTLVDKNNNEVVFWAITSCDRDPVIIKRPVLKMSGEYTGAIIGDIFDEDKMVHTFGDKIMLNKSTFAEVFKNIKGDFKYFIGNTANSFAYESVYIGNPSAYQTLIIGINDVCSVDDLSYFVQTSTSTQYQIDIFRRTGKVNTYGETSPFYGEEVVELLNAQIEGKKSYLNFGVDRIRVRYFND